MKIEKAIEILSITLEVKGQLSKEAEHDAIALGIEALKLIKTSRELWGNLEAWQLPGETED